MFLVIRGLKLPGNQRLGLFRRLWNQDSELSDLANNEKGGSFDNGAMHSSARCRLALFSESALVKQILYGKLSSKRAFHSRDAGAHPHWNPAQPTSPLSENL
jgi:hypothetical protein